MTLIREAFEMFGQSMTPQETMEGVSFVERKTPAVVPADPYKSSKEDVPFDLCKPPRPIFKKTTEKGAEVAVVVTPTELAGSIIPGASVAAKELKFERYTAGCCVQIRTAKFNGAYVRVEQGGIYLMTQGTGRSSRSLIDLQLDPFSVFDGNPRARNKWKALGASFDGKK